LAKGKWRRNEPAAGNRAEAYSSRQTAEGKVREESRRRGNPCLRPGRPARKEKRGVREEADSKQPDKGEERYHSNGRKAKEGDRKEGREMSRQVAVRGAAPFQEREKRGGKDKRPRGSRKA